MPTLGDPEVPEEHRQPAPKSRCVPILPVAGSACAWPTATCNCLGTRAKKKTKETKTMANVTYAGARKGRAFFHPAFSYDRGVWARGAVVCRWESSVGQVWWIAAKGAKSDNLHACRSLNTAPATHMHVPGRPPLPLSGAPLPSLAAIDVHAGALGTAAHHHIPQRVHNRSPQCLWRPILATS